MRDAGEKIRVVERDRRVIGHRERSMEQLRRVRRRTDEAGAGGTEHLAPALDGHDEERVDAEGGDDPSSDLAVRVRMDHPRLRVGEPLQHLWATV